MKSNWKPFILGLVAGLGGLFTLATAQQRPVQILPMEALIVNRGDQSVPVRFADPIKLDPKSEAIAVRAQTPLPVTMAAAGKWEYRFFGNVENMRNSLQAVTVEEALNKMGDGGWEMIGEWTFRRPKR